MKAGFTFHSLFVFISLISVISMVAEAKKPDDPMQEHIVGHWEGNGAVFDSVEFTSEFLHESSTSLNYNIYAFHAVLSEDFCERSLLPCPADRQLSGPYFVVSQVGGQSVLPRIRMWGDDPNSNVFNAARNVGSIFHPYGLVEGASSFSMRPRHNYFGVVTAPVVLRKSP